MMNVKVKKLHPDAVIPQYMTAGAAGFDLYAVEDCIIAPGDSVKLPLGLSFEVPDGYVLYICMRSGVALKTQLRQSNGVGVIDCDYRGEVSMMFDNITQFKGKVNFYRRINGDGCPTPFFQPHGTIKKIPLEVDTDTYIIKKGDRICQGIISPVVQAVMIETQELSDTERGTGGFGHTGS